MNLLDKVVRVIGTRPMEAVEFLLALVWLISGFWILAPWYHVDHTPALSAATQDISAKITAAWLLVISGPTIIALLSLKWPMRYQVRRFSSFCIFSTYLFFGITRIIIFSPANLVWLLHFALAFISGIAYIAMGWQRE